MQVCTQVRQPMLIAWSGVMVQVGVHESHSNQRQDEVISMMSLDNQVYYCEVLIARAERMGNYDAVQRLTEYETVLRRNNEGNCNAGR
jgi:hypothetical protein